MIFSYTVDGGLNKGFFHPTIYDEAGISLLQVREDLIMHLLWGYEFDKTPQLFFKPHELEKLLEYESYMAMLGSSGFYLFNKHYKKTSLNVLECVAVCINKSNNKRISTVAALWIGRILIPGAQIGDNLIVKVAATSEGQEVGDLILARAIASAIKTEQELHLS